MVESTIPSDLPARTNRPDDTSRVRSTVQNSFAPGAVDLAALVPVMYAFMFRNIASDGFIFSDPQSPGDSSRDSKPGCVIAAPSFPADTPGIGAIETAPMLLLFSARTRHDLLFMEELDQLRGRGDGFDMIATLTREEMPPAGVDGHPTG